MRPSVTEAVVDAAQLEAILTPRTGLVLEATDGRGAFTAADGPFHDYRRMVTVESAPDGTYRVRQSVDGELAIPYWGFLFRAAYRRRLARLGPDTAGGRPPWWAPPDRLDPQAAVTLAALAVLSAVLGYVSILLSQTITFAADEFGAGKSAQGVALAAVRFDILLSFPLIALTDRRGRRKVLLVAAAVACGVTALGALATSLPVLIATQVPARGLVTAAVVIVTIMAAEEMPSGARAYAVSLLTMAGAVGGGLCVVLLPLADSGTRGWRVLFAIAVAGLLPLRSVARHLAESRRFRAPHPDDVSFAGHGGRLWLLAVSGFLLAMFFTPASQFLNEYLREDRGFTGARIALFTVVTTIPASAGIIIGGWLADVRGRRGVGAAALVGGVGATVVMYAVSGWPLWAWSTFGSVIGAATVPALGVYGPELFPTALRGRANATLGLVARAGSVLGLVTVGYVADRHGLGPAMRMLAIGPIALAVLILVAYPETAHKALEEINPEDAEGAG